MNTDNLKVDPNAVERIKITLGKLSKYLPDFSDDLQLDFFVKKVRGQFRPKRVSKHRDYQSIKVKQSDFEGWVKLILPRKVLYAHFKGVSVRGALKAGVRNLSKEIKKYKELHFKSQSKYPHHETIRGGTNKT